MIISSYRRELNDQDHDSYALGVKETPDSHDDWIAKPGRWSRRDTNRRDGKDLDHHYDIETPN